MQSKPVNSHHHSPKINFQEICNKLDQLTDSELIDLDENDFVLNHLLVTSYELSHS